MMLQLDGLGEMKSVRNRETRAGVGRSVAGRAPGGQAQKWHE